MKLTLKQIIQLASKRRYEEILELLNDPNLEKPDAETIEKEVDDLISEMRGKFGGDKQLCEDTITAISYLITDYVVAFQNTKQDIGIILNDSKENEKRVLQMADVITRLSAEKERSTFMVHFLIQKLAAKGEDTAAILDEADAIMKEVAQGKLPKSNFNVDDLEFEADKSSQDDGDLNIIGLNKFTALTDKELKDLDKAFRNPNTRSEKEDDNE